MIAGVIEAVLFALALACGVFLTRAAVGGVLAKAARSAELEPLRGSAEVLAAADRGVLLYVSALLALGAARAWSGRRGGRGNVRLPVVLPSLALLTGLGLAVQFGYGDPLHRSGFAGPPFAIGLFAAASLGALVLLLPGDPASIAHRVRWPLGIGLAGVLLALAAFGTGPAGSDTRINLGPIQPLEAAKLGFVLLVAPYLGRRAAKLRYQRQRFAVFRWPRPRLLLPALALLVALQAILFAVRDLGPVVVTSAVFLTLFYVATRSGGFVLLALGLVGSSLAAVLRFPEIVPSHTVWERIAMWWDPWLNALPGGDQLARGLWAHAAGGLLGQGLGAAPVGALPAGHNDMVIAHLAEELGTVGVGAYVIAVASLVVSGAVLAGRARTPERALVAVGLAALLGAQAALIFAGSSGLFPLTGIVAPYLSAGRSSMAAFVVLAALLLRLAEGGALRADTDELREIRRGSAVVAVVAAALACGALVHAYRIEVVDGPATTSRGIVTVQADGTVRHVHDPRVESLLAQIPRGEFLDRRGRVLAGTSNDGNRIWPLGVALGTLLGPADERRLRPSWSLERQHDGRLRGYGTLPDGPAVWLGRNDRGEHVLFAVPSRVEQAPDRARAIAQSGSDAVRLLPLPSPDLSEIARIARLRPVERAVAVEAFAVRKPDRSITLSLDADLQVATADVLAAAAKRGKAAAAVVIDVDTGQVLARAQVPDLDLSSRDWSEKLDARDAAFLGAYGPWPDKTGVRGFLQAGSIAKVWTALVAAREMPDLWADGCGKTRGPTYSCSERDQDGPLFTRPGWPRAIHDFHKDPNHGEIGLRDALAVSCNVWFGQLGLALGPDPFAAMAADGAEIGWGGAFRPGDLGSRQLASTAFGQGAAALSPMQAARLVAAIGAAGTYRKCPPSLELDAVCEATPLLANPAAATAILSGLHAVMESGTGKGLKPPAGVRVYGKSGTADAPGLAEEVPYGIRRGDERAKPHSWFVALAEPDDAPPCGSAVRGRLAVAVAVARGGSGSGAAGTATIQIIDAARSLGYLGGTHP